MKKRTKNNLLIVAAAIQMIAMSIIGALILGFFGALLCFIGFWAGAICLRGEPHIEVDNSILPFRGYKCINICGYLFCDGTLSDVDINHEAIHTAQMKEMGYIGFYLWYFGEWAYQAVWRIFDKKMQAYYFITMEQEAYKNEANLEYLTSRECFAWWEFFGKWKKY